MVRDAPNIQALWGSLLVEELIRCGVDQFVVSPGSRSTPLVQAIARNRGARATIWNDERGAAFHALGRGRAGQATAVVTTSGTAVANLLPAVVEASLDGVPLILLTADRPPELREVGANQSIRQMGIFADHVRWAIDLPAPDDTLPARMLLTTVDHAVGRATSASHPGPVQINCPFREPLAPNPAPWDPDCLAGLEAWLDDETPFTWIAEVEDPYPAHEAWLDDLAAGLFEAHAGLVVVGDVPSALEPILLARDLGWPMWRDARCPVADGQPAPNDLPHVDRLLGRGFDPSVVVQLGARPTSARIQRWLDDGGPQHYVVVDPTPERIDPGHRVTHRFRMDVAHWCDAVSDALRPLAAQAGAVRQVPGALLARHAALKEATAASLNEGDALSEPWVARRLTALLDPTHALFVSNSMPIRDVQAYRVTDRTDLKVVGNRGASGIDGIVSTAAGFAQAAECPLTLLIGDLALLHDLNALMHLGALARPVTIVVLNNCGGSIFSFLPIATHPDVLAPLVETPHAVSFQGVCRSFSLPYVLAESRAGFDAAYEAAISSGRSSVIEVASTLAENRAHHERIEEAIDAAASQPAARRPQGAP